MKIKLTPGLFVVVLVFVAVLIGAWVVNIVKLFGMVGEGGVSTMFIARIVGIFIQPIGVVLGFM